MDDPLETHVFSPFIRYRKKKKKKKKIRKNAENQRASSPIASL